MKWVLLGVGGLLGALVLYAVAHLALIELGREVVVLHRWTSEGKPRRTRLWIVEDQGNVWLHHGWSESPWIQRLQEDPIVTVERSGTAVEYRATPDPEAHQRVHELLREKYGFADWWVRFVTGGTEDCGAVPVRLERLPGAR